MPGVVKEIGQGWMMREWPGSCCAKHGAQGQGVSAASCRLDLTCTATRHTPLPPGCRCPCVQQVLTPIQTARVIVHSFPYFPNAREIATRMMMLRK